MEKNPQEKLTDVLSIISRTSALMLGLAIIFAGGYFLDYQKQNTNQAFDKAELSANIINSPVYVIAKTFSDEVEEKNIQGIKRMAASSQDIHEFQQDVLSWSEIIEKKTDMVDRGFFLSVKATTTGNTIHPFWGYFSVKNGKISKTDWGEDAYGIILPVPMKTSDDEYFVATITNMGPYPWPTDDTWINDAEQEEVVIAPENKKDFIAIGEKATLIYHKTDSFQLKNQDKGFRVILTSEE